MIRFTRLTPAVAAFVVATFTVNAIIWQLTYLSLDSKACRQLQDTKASKVHRPAVFKKREHKAHRRQKQQRQHGQVQHAGHQDYLLPLPASLPEVPTAARCSHSTTKMRQLCSRLAESGGDATTTGVNKTQLSRFRNESKAVDACQVAILHELLTARNCSHLKQQRGYGRWPVTPEELDFPLAFSFKLHKSPEMFERLLSVLWRPHNLYVIHVDRKVPEATFQLIGTIADCFHNVIVTDTRIDIVYASILSLQADIVCMKEALKSPIPWRYHLTVSGQEFPLKTNLELVQILKLLNGSNDIENYSVTMSIPFMNVLIYKAQITNGKIFLTDEQRSQLSFPKVEIRKGSAYNSMSREFLEWALQDHESQTILLWLNDTWAADELFWATVGFLPNAPGGVGAAIRHEAGTHLSRAVLWQWDQPPCHGLYVRKICIFSTLDLPWLLGRPELIANKFDAAYDPMVLDCLQQDLERRAVQGFREVMTSAAHPVRGAVAQSPPALARSAGVEPHGREVVGGGDSTGAGGGEGRETEERTEDDEDDDGKEEFTGSREKAGAGAKMSRGVLVSSLNWTYYRSLPHLRYQRRDGW